MLYLLRHILSVLLLPAMMLLVVPIWIARRWNVGPAWPQDWLEWVAAAAGIIVGAVGLLLFGASVRRFALDGRGTLAPWDPPGRLVVGGPYRYVRNPMISGVLLMLAGGALAARSWRHAIWAAAFGAINLIFIMLVEEPVLEARFEDEYRIYKRAVPRFLPLRRPWTGEGAAGTLGPIAKEMKE